ncbi:hypothetical protein [Corynebacterium sanguinis]
MSEPAEPRQRSRIRVRVWHIVLLVVAVVASLLLAYWQWTRYQSGTGTFQNLGYALQWPFFGAFFVYAYRAGLRMENEKIDAVNEGRSLDELYQADLARYGDDETEIDTDFLPPRPELGVEEFNALNQPRRGHHRNGES